MLTFFRPTLAIALFAMVLTAASTVAQPASNWPRFRGPDGTGIADDPALPERWSATENVVWKTNLPGMGWSSPVVWGDRIFVTAVVSTRAPEPPKPGLYFGGERPTPSDEHRWMVYAIDFATGKTVWEREAHRAIPAQSRHLKNSYASETPVTDGERVYVSFGNVGLFAFRLDGTPVWQHKWPARATRNGWGTAASPVLHQGRLYFVSDNEEDSHAGGARGRHREGTCGGSRGRRKRTGRRRTSGSTRSARRSSRRRRAASARYDLGGRPLWELKGMSTIVIPTPFASDGLLYVTSGYVGDTHRPAYAIKPGATGDISIGSPASAEFVAWYQPQAGPYNTSPIVYGGVYYTLLDRGFFTAHDARTGKELYGRQRVAPEGIVAFTSSPWASNGKIFALSEDGDTYVIRAGPRYELLGKNTLGEMAMATPAIARGSLIPVVA